MISDDMARREFAAMRERLFSLRQLPTEERSRYKLVIAQELWAALCNLWVIYDVGGQTYSLNSIYGIGVIVDSTVEGWLLTEIPPLR